MKILVVSKPLEPPFHDGSKNLARDVVLACPSHVFRVFTSGGQVFGKRHIREEPLYTPPNAWMPPYWNSIKLFVRLLKPEPFDLIHFFFTPNPLTSTMGRWAMQMRLPTRCIQTVCSAPKTFAGLASQLFADRIVTVSDHTLQQLTEIGVRHATRIYPAVRPISSLSDLERKDLRQHFGMPDGEVFGLFAGDIEFSNASDMLLEAARRLPKTSRAKLLFCHRFKTPVAKARQDALLSRLRAEGLEQTIRFLPEQEDLIPLIQASDFLVMTPDTLWAKLDLPLTLLEAMACGKPSIISDFGPLPEAFQNEKAGLIVPASQPEELAEAIGRISESEEDRTRMGDCARDVARRVFSLEKLGEAHRALYESLI